jgi:lipoate-protein ligase A
VTPDPGGGWRVERWTGGAGALHARTVEEPFRRTVVLLQVDRPAVVLGSAQPDAAVDRGAAVAAGLAVARRHSGGGAVLVEPGASAWIDVVLPRHDPLWDDDIGRSFLWLGEAWAEALAGQVAGAALVVHRGAMVVTPWSPVVCFAGLGPGEVTVGPGGPKLVGLSQRRTRAGARFQCIVHRRWHPDRLVEVLAPTADERAAATAALAGAAAEVDLDSEAVLAALLAHLPA